MFFGHVLSANGGGTTFFSLLKKNNDACTDKTMGKQQETFPSRRLYHFIISTSMLWLFDSPYDIKLMKGIDD